MNWERQIAAFFKERRKELKINGTTLGGAAGVDHSVFSRIEIGKRAMRLKEMLAFADALDIDLADMFSKLQNGEQLTQPPPREIEVDGVRYVIADG